MSVNANYTGNIRKPICAALSGTAKTVIGAAATDRTQTLASWSFVNPTGAAVVCELYWNDGTDDHLMWRKSVASNSTEIESNLPIRLETGNSVKALGAANIAVNLVYALAYQVS
ncbi:hypothetical protein [Rhizobium rhizogenes]|uniref:hypothetical protein n=1 Tax=Rhizobium rhizogenes TaxID=359 RepID=UPI0022CCB81D|nr:hypothetical protein [Rhizobium rhizogenes]MCZ7480557.1 hypothetical protein [Rhizobium rhizogenes]